VPSALYHATPRLQVTLWGWTGSIHRNAQVQHAMVHATHGEALILQNSRWYPASACPRHGCCAVTPALPLIAAHAATEDVCMCAQPCRGHTHTCLHVFLHLTHNTGGVCELQACISEGDGRFLYRVECDVVHVLRHAPMTALSGRPCHRVAGMLQVVWGTTFFFK